MRCWKILILVIIILRSLLRWMTRFCRHKVIVLELEEELDRVRIIVLIRRCCKVIIRKKERKEKGIRLD